MIARSRGQVTSSSPRSIRAIALWLVPARRARRRWVRALRSRVVRISSSGVMMPYTVSEGDQLEGQAAALHARETHRMRGGAAALGRAARVEDLEAVVGPLMERQVGV